MKTVSDGAEMGPLRNGPPSQTDEPKAARIRNHFFFPVPHYPGAGQWRPRPHPTWPPLTTVVAAVTKRTKRQSSRVPPQRMRITAEFGWSGLVVTRRRLQSTSRSVDSSAVCPSGTSLPSTRKDSVATRSKMSI